MHPFIRTAAALALVAFAASCAANVEVRRGGANPEAEARAFMESYARDLRAGAREAIVARYDRRGAYLVGNGRKELLTVDALRAIYTGPDWQPPATFEWRDLSYEVLGDDAVMVVGRFEWTDAQGKMLPISYTGLLLRQDGAWRIRLEDESVSPRDVRDQLCAADTARR
ncbi:MAG: ketosteroid isomerase family protein [Gemmatimonadetes bacterium]|nr:ketosteroid isomerase family protein [Gemmatimonadota bacterium]